MQVTVLTCRHVTDYKTSESTGSLPSPFLKALKTQNFRDPVCCSLLEQPNIVHDLPAAGGQGGGVWCSGSSRRPRLVVCQGWLRHRSLMASEPRAQCRTLVLVLRCHGGRIAALAEQGWHLAGVVRSCWSGFPLTWEARRWSLPVLLCWLL